MIQFVFATLNFLVWTSSLNANIFSLFSQEGQSLQKKNCTQYSFVSDHGSTHFGTGGKLRHPPIQQFGEPRLSGWKHPGNWQIWVRLILSNFGHLALMYSVTHSCWFRLVQAGFLNVLHLQQHAVNLAKHPFLCWDLLDILAWIFSYFLPNGSLLPSNGGQHQSLLASYIHANPGHPSADETWENG